jgi:hypothetical protein
MKNQLFTARKLRSAAGAVLMLLMVTGGAGRTPTQASAATTSPARQTATGSKFYCNIKALNPADRAHHKQLTDKLIRARKEIVETEKGYEFQFSPTAVSIAELADWVVAEAKCCPFFYFHIDLEREGSLVCLGLTGPEGIKPFIRTEFQVPGK